mgnify:CR=1 FL=1
MERHCSTLYAFYFHCYWHISSYRYNFPQFDTNPCICFTLRILSSFFCSFIMAVPCPQKWGLRYFLFFLFYFVFFIHQFNFCYLNKAHIMSIFVHGVHGSVGIKYLFKSYLDVNITRFTYIYFKSKNVIHSTIFNKEEVLEFIFTRCAFQVFCYEHDKQMSIVRKYFCSQFMQTENIYFCLCNGI